MHLRAYLWKHKLTIQEFAEKIGYNRHHISRVMRGEQRPAKKLAIAIETATAGEVTAEELLNIKEDKS